MSEKPPLNGQLELSFAPEIERQSMLDSSKKLLLQILSSNNSFDDKKMQIIQVALKYPQGENACREFYQEKVGVSFRGFADNHGYDELVAGILTPELEIERLRNLDSQYVDPSDQGFWKPNH